MATQDDGRSATSGALGLTDEKINGRCSFVIALNSEGQLEISPKEAGTRAQQGAEQRQDRICSGICSAEDKIKAEKVQTPSVNKQRISIALIKHDPDAFDSLQVASDVSCQRNSRMGFVKVFNGEDLRRKPSFVVLEEALVRKRLEQSSESSVKHVQQEASRSKTEESPKDAPPNSGSSNRSPNRFKRRNAGMQQYQGEAKVASNSSLLPEATRPSTATHNRQPTEQQAMDGSTPSHGTFSFVPASPAQSVNPMMYPCPQYLNNNMAIRYLNGCNCCNCCPFRQAAPDHGCCNCSSCCALSYVSNCSPLRPPAGAAAGAATASVPQMQPSLSYCQPNVYAMPMVTQQMFAPLLQPTGEPQQQQQQQYPCGWYPYPPSAPCHSMQQCFCQPMTTISMGSNCCRMNAAYPCPHCGSFVNSPQMQQQLPQQQKTQLQNQETQSAPCGNQQHQETQSVPCSSQRQRRCPIKRPKVPDSSDASSSPVNREELRRMFGPSSTQQQPKTKQQAKPSNAKESTAMPAKETRSMAGRTESISMGAGKQTTSLYMARFGRTCMLMKPASTSTSMPRLLTRRISRYTSVMAWPTNHKSEHN